MSNEQFKAELNLSGSINQSVQINRVTTEPEEDTEKDSTAWDKLTFWDKAKLVNEWTLIIMIANIIHIIGTSLLMMNVKTIKKNGAILVGFAAFFIWTSIMRYFVDKRGYSIV